MIHPSVLQAGDTVALVSTSSPVPAHVVEKSISYLEGLGFRVETGRHILSNAGFMAGTAAQRASDLHEAFLNPAITAIFCAYGGSSSSQLLPLLDMKLIAENPKILMGLSDPTALILGVQALTGLITFHGPTGYNFGEAGMTEFTERHMLAALTHSTPVRRIENRPDWTVFKPGRAHGPMVGGNLTIMQSLIGTPYEPDWTGRILFWEDLFIQFHTIDCILTQMKLAGILSKISGMVIGRLVECEETDVQHPESLEALVNRIVSDFDFPILYGVDLGHTDDKITIPIGALAELHCDVDNPQLLITESPFSPYRSA